MIITKENNYFTYLIINNDRFFISVNYVIIKL